MNSMQEALSKAGVVAEDFKANESLKFSRFPIITKWRPSLPERCDYMDETFKYKQGHKSTPLQQWVEMQDKNIIKFLKKNKDRVYIFPSDVCQKYLECWIGYNSVYQSFVIRVNNLAQLVHPWSTPANSYAFKLVDAVYNTLGFDCDDRSILTPITFLDILNRLNRELTATVIRKAFNGQTIVPVEAFDPIVEINSIVSSNLIVAESTNLDVIRKQLAEMEESDCVLSNSKLHKNIIDLYCGFNNIKVIDPCGVSETKNNMNLIFAKDVNGTKKKNKSFFIVV